MTVLRAAASYPFRRDRRLDVLLVGGGVQLASAFVPLVPLVFVLGYLVRTAASTSATGSALRSARPPGFDRPLALFRTGVGAAVVAAPFLLFAVGTLALTAVGASLARADVASNAAGAIAFFAASTVTLFTALAALYPLPAALVGYARTGRIRGAFDRRRLWTAARSGRYFYGTTVGYVALGVGAALFEPLNAVALGFFVAFYLEVVAVALWGWGAAAVTPTPADRSADGRETADSSG